MRLQRNNIITVLDIGTAKIVCLVAKINADGSPQVIGIGERATKGVRAGIISDISAAKEAVAQAIHIAQQTSNTKISKLYLSVPSTILLSQRISAAISVVGHEINFKDLNKLLMEVLSNYQKQPLDVIHSFACNYILDGNHGISNPLGMYGDSLACEMHVLAAPSNLLLNLTNTVNNLNVEVANYISSAYANGIACLQNDEIEIGSTLIDMGAGHTSISLFEKGNLLFTDAIAIGGMHITNDIAKTLCTTLVHAERIKNLYGTTTLDALNDTIELPMTHNGDVYTVKRSTLNEIIHAKISEILSLLARKLHDNNLEPFHRFILTGHGSKLHGLQNFVSQTFDAKTRLATPLQLKGIQQHHNDHIPYTTAIGMVLHLLQYQNTAQTHSNSSWISSLFKKLTSFP